MARFIPSFATLIISYLLTGSTLAQGSSGPAVTQTNSSLAVGASPIFTDVPPASVAESAIVVELTQKLSLYGIALDTKNFSALGGAFAENVVPNVAVVPIKGLAAYEAFLQSDLAMSKTKHTTDTVFVYDIISNQSAKSISYSDATYFGQGATLGQTFTFFERFDDTWTKADGSWKILERTLVFFGVSGNRTVLSPAMQDALVTAGLVPP